MLLPNNKQKSKLFLYANTSRFVYNWAIARERSNYKDGNKFISDYDLRKEFTQLKKLEKYGWLNTVSNDAMKQSIKDACDAYKKFFKHQINYPKFKSRKFSMLSFYQDNVKIRFTETHVKVEGFAGSRKKNRQKLNWIKLAEHNRIPTNCKYHNPRIKYDGLNWYITVGVDYDDCAIELKNDGIGIDLGIKDLAICSDGNIYKNINKSKKIRNLEKKKRRLQHSVSRKIKKSKRKESYRESSNLRKTKKKFLKVNHKLTNIRLNHLHQITSSIIKREPSFICIEDLNVSGMMKNHHLSKAVQQQCFYEFKRQIEYKALWNNIKIVVADRFYPSSKTCYCCGNVKKDLKLSDRVYKCECCGNTIDRDYQASLNLQRYGENFVK